MPTLPGREGILPKKIPFPSNSGQKRVSALRMPTILAFAVLFLDAIIHK